MLSLSKTLDIAISIQAATARLTDTILGNDDHDLTETLRAIASEIGVSHIAYLRLSPDKSTDVCLLVAVVTYSGLWQQRYSRKQYVTHDPVICYGRGTDQPFDWANVPTDDPATKAFFTDALNHNVGRNGLSIPFRGRRGVFSVVSFTSDLSKDEWEAYKAANVKSLRLLSVLIDCASHINFKLPALPVHLSNREEQCLIWAARGKTCQEIAAILGLAYGTVKRNLDTARHKLHCMNLTHPAAVALATGVIPAQALK
jgi:LuxR family quorum-sensing system transcriptional regulator CciR